MHGGKRVYQEGRDAFRNSVPCLRVDSVDAPSLFEPEESVESLVSEEGSEASTVKQSGRRRGWSLSGRR